MTYDITMCNGRGCSRVKTCYRAIVYNKYKKDKNRPLYVWMVEPTDNCSWYWEE